MIILEEKKHLIATSVRVINIAEVILEGEGDSTLGSYPNKCSRCMNIKDDKILII